METIHKYCKRVNSCSDELCQAYLVRLSLTTRVTASQARPQLIIVLDHTPTKILNFTYKHKNTKITPLRYNYCYIEIMQTTVAACMYE